MKKLARGLLYAAALAVAPAPAFAAMVPGFNGSALPRCDDCFSTAQSLGFTANFFGTNYTQTYVSNNGYVTFEAGQSSFTPQGLGDAYAGQPIIAAFFTDLDTRSLPAQPVGFGTGTFDGRNAFGVNYNPVGQFPNDYSLLNSFQILLVDRSNIAAGDFDIVFNYDDMQFGRNASVGYNAGQDGTPDGTYYQLPGSLNGEAFANGGTNALVSNSNVGIAGRYVFTVRNGIVDPGSPVPEPATWAMMLIGFGLVGGTMRSARGRKAIAAA